MIKKFKFLKFLLTFFSNRITNIQSYQFKKMIEYLFLNLTLVRKTLIVVLIFENLI
jgi:hypothetical protein